MVVIFSQGETLKSISSAENRMQNNFGKIRNKKRFVVCEETTTDSKAGGYAVCMLGCYAESSLAESFDQYKTVYMYMLQPIKFSLYDMTMI